MSLTNFLTNYLPLYPNTPMYKLLLLSLSLYTTTLYSQATTPPAALVAKLKTKYNLANDYVATGKLKTNVLFIKAAIANVKIYFKKPNKLKIKNENGISFIPKGSMNVNMANLFTITNYTALDAGVDKVDGKAVRVVKVLPTDTDNSDIVLSTLYIDEANMLILKSKTNTKDNGSYELLMQYGNQASYGLPSKIIFTFNVKDYKLPKGVTFDYDNGSTAETATKTKTRKGKVEITYNNYVINQGIADSVFQ